MLNYHHQQRGRSLFIQERSRIRSLFLVTALLISFFGIRGAHDSSASSASSPNDASAAANSYLLLCLTDGSIYSVQAWTGEYEASIVTDPLLQTHRTSASTDIVLPGLDGRLYWRPPSPHLDNENTAPPVQQQPLQELPLTVHALLENPVRSCEPTEPSSGASTLEDCGILTAEAVTSLLALTETGQLLWKTQGSSGSNTRTETETSGRNNILLLQRKDYWVQHVMASTGQQSWNVSLGTYHALDFGLPTEEDTLLLDDDDDILNDVDHHRLGGPPLLPAVVFSNQGRTVTAIDPVHSTVLWRQHVPSTLSAIFGICAGQWKTVPVVTASEFMEKQQHHEIQRPMLPSFSQQQQEQHELEQFLWTQHQQQWAVNQQQHYYQYPIGLPGSKTADSKTSRKDMGQQGMNQLPGNGNGNEDVVCLVNGEIVEGSCPNLYAPQLLHLPSPTTAAVTKANPLSVASDGLLLSWSLVMALVLVLVVTVASGRFWYVRKKAKWLTEGRQCRPSVDESHDLSSSFSLHGGLSRKHSDQQQHQHTLKRSNSLPGVLGSPDPLRHFPQTTVLSPPIALPNSDDGKISLQAPPPRPILPGGTTIPLVRYSRYASEFIELRSLGKGGFGSVFQCKNALDGRDYAIKKVSIRSSSSSRENLFQQQLERVLREVKILAVLDHPNIVRYYTAWLEIDAGEAAAAEHETTSLSKHHLKNQSRFAHEYDDDQSRCYSSSLLLDTDSVSGWGVASHNGSQHVSRNGTGKNSHQHYYVTQHNDPLGWNNTGFDMESESSKSASSSMFATKQRSLKHTSFDDLIVFAEKSSEDEGDASSPDSKSEVEELSSSNLEHTSPLHPRRRSFSLGGPSDTLLTRSKTTTQPLASSLPTDTTTRENGDSSGLNLRHTLYIQMQLCSRKTVAEFLANSEARRGPDSTTHTGVDIPKALRLFLQIAEAVKHVHSQSLIHRDLKPSNCFMDDSGSTVKVGDFGLSRESTFLSDDPDVDEGGAASSGRTKRKTKNTNTPQICGNDDHTAGVGTRLYASPEQMNGSDYDSSTDVYSLGIMLFELLYPMYTGMERNICLSRLRSQTFPDDWEETVGNAFPTMRSLIVGMLSVSPSARPTAESVARHVQSVLGEFTILSLDTEHYVDSEPDVVLLRVEAEHRDDTLPHTMQLIRDESAAMHGYPVEIVQYGLRSSSSSSDNHNGPATAIMEFALKFQDNATDPINAQRPPSAAQLVNNLRLHPEIFKARQVTRRRVAEALSTHS